MRKAILNHPARKDLVNLYKPGGNYMSHLFQQSELSTLCVSYDPQNK
jgi:hypothetical protein